MDPAVGLCGWARLGSAVGPCGWARLGSAVGRTSLSLHRPYTGFGNDPLARLSAMFHCAILFRLKAGIPLDRVRGARSSLQALVETLPGVEHFTVTHNLAPDSGGYNLALFSTFESKPAFEICQRHPEYLRVLERELAPLVESRVTAWGEGES